MKHQNLLAKATLLSLITSIIFSLQIPLFPQSVKALAQEEWASPLMVNDLSAAEQDSAIVKKNRFGDFIAIWLDSNSNHYAQKFDINGNKLWGSNVQLTNHATADSTVIDAVVDTNGGIYFSYTNNNNLYLQYVDVDGNVWQMNGYEIYNDTVNDSVNSDGSLLGTGTDGVYIAWSVLNSGNRYTYVTHVGPTGSVAGTWNTSGSGDFRPVQLGGGAGFSYPQITGIGGSYLLLSYKHVATNSLRIEKIDSVGANEWGPHTISNVNQIDDWTMVYDGSGGAIIAYNTRNNWPYNIIAVNYSTLGSVNWTTTLGTSLNYAPYIHGVADNAGGAIFFWNHEDAADWDVDVYGQKVDYTGAPQWNSGNMMAVANSSSYYETLVYDKNASIVYDGSGGAFIGFAAPGSTNDSSGVQYVRSSGIKDFGTHGKLLGYNTWDPSLADDGSGGVIFTWTGTETAVFTNYDIWAQRLTSVIPPPATYGAIEIHVEDNLTGSSSATSSGVSNGDDGALADINFTGTPTSPNDNFSGAERYDFSGGSPTRTVITPNIESLAGTEFSAGASSIKDEDDAVSDVIPLGFTTTIYNQEIDSVSVSSNGFIYLNNSANFITDLDGCCQGYSMSDYSNLPSSINGSGTGNILVAGKWTDLAPVNEPTASVRYSTEGSAPNRRFIITYENVPYYDPSGPLNTFQIKIYESASSEGGGESCTGTGLGEACASQTIDCGTGPTIPNFSDLTFNTVTTSEVSQGTSASQGAFTIEDNRGNECVGSDGVNLTVEMTDNFIRTIMPDGVTVGDNRPLLNGTDFNLDVGETASALSLAMSAPTCTACSDFESTVSYPISEAALSENSSLTPILGGVELFNEVGSFAGFAQFSGIDFSLTIPPNALAGTYTATLTYTLTI